MKKLLLIALVLMMATPAYAAAGNIFASWYTVTTEITITLPFETVGGADIVIVNGDAADPICVSLKGTAIGPDCKDDGNTVNPSITQIGFGDSLALYNFVTDSIRLKSAAGESSPVSVIINY